MIAIIWEGLSVMKLFPRGKWANILFISVIVYILYFFYFYRPIMAETEDILNRIYTVEQDVENNKSLDMELKMLNDELSSLYEELGLLQNDAFGGRNQAEIILFMEDLVRPLGVMKNIRFEQIEDYGAYKVARMVISIDTSYANLKRIVKELEQAPWKNRIEKMKTVVKGNSVSQKYNIEVEMTVELYCL